MLFSQKIENLDSMYLNYKHDLTVGFSEISLNFFLFTDFQIWLAGGHC